MSDRDFRLSTGVMPSRYDLRIEVDLDAWRFEASERIDVQIHRPTAEITLHALELALHAVRAVAAGRTLTATVQYNAEAETATLRFPEPLPAGPVCLEIDFSGAILERLRGFYRSVKDGARYAATQFEAADARRAFPCFDEPEFKARFALTLVVPPARRRHRQRRARRRAHPARRPHRAPFRRDAADLVVPGGLLHRPVRGDPGGAYAERRAGARLPAARHGRQGPVRPRRARALARLPRRLHRHPLPLRQGRRDRRAGLRSRRDGESRRHHLPPDRDRRRPGARLDTGAEGHLLHRRARAHPHVVGRSGDDGVVGRPVAERVVRHLRRLQGHRRPDARVGHVARLRRHPRPPLHARRAGVDAPDLVRGEERATGHRALRRHHLLEGRRRRAHDRGLPRRRRLPCRRAQLSQPLPRGERHRRRLLARAGRRRRAATSPPSPTPGSRAGASGGARHRHPRRAAMSRSPSRRSASSPTPRRPRRTRRSAGRCRW